MQYLRKLRNLSSIIGLDGFVVAVVIAIFLAWLVPGTGAKEGPLTLRTAAHYGISVVFFFYGVGLSRAKFVANMGNFRLHVLIQLTTFLVFPLIGLGLYSLFASDADRDLWLGVFFLTALPSTVSTSVVMVSLARGNLPAAIFNASLSSVLGILITPIWMSLFLATSNGDFNLLGSMIDLTFVVILPIGLGMLFNPTKFGHWIAKKRRLVNYFDQSVVLLIVHTSFCDSFAHQVFADCTFAKLAALCAFLLLLFFTMYGLILLACRMLKFNREDSITALFCGSKKSLMHGVTMSKVLFRGNAAVGMIVLPLMLYHALQLIIAGVIARSIQKRYDVSLSLEAEKGDGS